MVPTAAFIACALALAPASASAATTRLAQGSFTGADTTAGAFAGVNRLAFSQSNSSLFALDSGNQAIDQFDNAGAAKAFSDPGASGASSLAVGSFGGDPDIAVDNSGTATDGNFYFVSEGLNELYGFDSTGAALTGFPVSLTGDNCGVGVDPGGNIWVSDYSSGLHEYDATGAPEAGSLSGYGRCHLTIDATGNLYWADWGGAVNKYNPDGAGGFVADPTTPTLDSGSAQAISSDPATGHVFVVHSSSISEYDSAGSRVGTFGSGTLQSAIGAAVDAATDSVFVADASGSGLVYIFGGPVVVPDATTSPASNVAYHSATLNGSVDPAGAPLTDCHFDYGTNTSYGQTAPCAEDPGSGSGAVSVHADVTGLASNQSYHFRLVAANANGTANGGDQSFSTPPEPSAPAVANESLKSASTTDAIVTADVTPGYAATTYHVEYGRTAGYGSSTPESASIGADNSSHQVQAHLDNLEPGATYYFRFVATNSVGTTDGGGATFGTFPSDAAQTDCPNQQYRGGLGGLLPECRAYEQVSAPDKDGTDIGYPTNFQAPWTSPDGRQVLYTSTAAFANSPADGIPNTYLAQRQGDGWKTYPATAPQNVDPLELNSSIVVGTSDDLLQHLVTTNAALTPEAIDGTGNRANLYAHDVVGGTYSYLGTETSESPANFGTSQLEAELSLDGSVAVVNSPTPLTNDSPPTAQFGNYTAPTLLYENSPNGLRYAGILPDGTTKVNAQLANPDRSPRPSYHALSEDGSRLFFSEMDEVSVEGGPNLGPLYLRANGRTALVSKRYSDGDAAPANFWYATKDGSYAYLTSPTALTADAGTGASPPHSGIGDLYQYDTATKTLTDLTPGDTQVDFVFGIGGANGDPYVYFSSQGVLATGATAGAPNVYVWHAGNIRLVFTANTGLDQASWHPSANGRYFGGFATVALGGPHPQPAPLHRSAYLYDYGRDTLSCASCSPTGLPPAGDSLGPDLYGFLGGPLQASQVGSRRAVTNNGQMFFTSPTALSDRDTNGKLDAYEYVNGHIYLLSSGKSQTNSYFADASESGDDAIVTTASQLVSQDVDFAVDAYDVRVGGGYPASNASPAGSDCAAEACHGSPGSSPATPAVSSDLPGTSGNQEPPRPRARIAILTRRGTGSVFTLKVRVSGKGLLLARGRAIRKVVRHLNGARTVALRVRLTKAAARRLAHKHRLAVSVRLIYIPLRGDGVTRTAHVRLHPGKRHTRIKHGGGR